MQVNLRDGDNLQTKYKICSPNMSFLTTSKCILEASLGKGLLYKTKNCSPSYPHSQIRISHVSSVISQTIPRIDITALQMNH